MPFHPTAIARVRAALKKRGTQAPQDRPLSDFPPHIQRRLLGDAPQDVQRHPTGFTDEEIEAGLVLPVPDTLPRSFTLTSPEQSRALSEGFITRLPRRETTFDPGLDVGVGSTPAMLPGAGREPGGDVTDTLAGVGSEITGGFRRIGREIVRGAEGGIGEFKGEEIGRASCRERV